MQQKYGCEQRVLTFIWQIVGGCSSRFRRKMPFGK